jgi:succinate dehydrogenase/fumarate reductase cytochrome b subunit
VNEWHKISGLVAGFFVFIMILAAWSRLGSMKETPKTIEAGSNFLSRLFVGVLK